MWGVGLWDAADSNDYEVTRIPVSVRLELAEEHVIRMSATRARIARLDLVVAKDLQTPRPTERR